jgi:adenosylcobinamide-phosphate synthase
VNRALATAAAIVLDQTFGEPPIRPHPVAVLGHVLAGTERALYADRRAAGVVHALVGLALGVGAGRVVRSTTAAAYVAMAGRALGQAAASVDAALAHGDLAGARALLPALVGRDPEHLDEAGVCRAVVESVAENTVDAVIAPALWAAVGGASGVLAHRAVNTMDAMIGHRTVRYTRYGWAAARLDDVAAWVPARMAAALVAAVRPQAATQVLATVRRDAPAHPSPNAGAVQAAFAAALGVRLGGPSTYGGRVEVRPMLGDGRPPARVDIRRAVRLSDDMSRALAGGLAALGLLRVGGR